MIFTAAPPYLFKVVGSIQFWISILNLAILSKLTFFQIKTINMLNSQTHKNFLSDTLSQLWFHLTLLFCTSFVSLLVDPHHACLILMVESTKFTFYEENMATGETSQAITPFHFFDNSNFHHYITFITRQFSSLDNFHH